jgi:hypothetical protein
MKQLSLLFALTLIGCGGSGPSTNPLAGTYTGTSYTTNPEASTPASLTISPSGALSGSLTGSVDDSGTITGAEAGHAYTASGTLVILVSSSAGVVTTFEMVRS